MKRIGFRGWDSGFGVWAYEASLGEVQIDIGVEDSVADPKDARDLPPRPPEGFLFQKCFRVSCSGFRVSCSGFRVEG